MPYTNANTAQMDLANLAINTRTYFPFAEDEHLYAEDHNDSDTSITPVCTHQPVLQARPNVRHPLPPSYGYHFPATPHSPHPIPHAFGYSPPPPTPINYRNPNDQRNYFQLPQHIQHGHIQVIPHTRTVTSPPLSLPNTNKRDHSLSPQKPKKRTRGGGHKG